MDLFKKKDKKEEKPIEEERKFESHPVSETEEKDRMDEEAARVRFKIIIRQLNDVEEQIKTGKFIDIDETKRDKVPTLNYMLNQAEGLKLMIKDYMNAFESVGYTEEDVERLKNEALEGRKSYVFYTK